MSSSTDAPSGAETSATSTSTSAHHSGTQASSTSSSQQLLGPKSDTVVNVKTLLEAGAHFGHQTERWNPKMMPYIYTQRNGVHIIDLDLTLRGWERARKFIADKVAIGGSLLFVGTKLQGREIVIAEAARCGAFHITTRWLGGTLTNFQTIKNSIDRMRKLEELLVKANDEKSDVKLNKKERLTIARDLSKLEANLGGIRSMRRVPDVLFVMDINKEAIAVSEARRLHIPVVALVDTNTDPSVVDFPIPSNDDSARTLKLFAAAVADAVLDGREAFEARSTKSEASSGSTETNGGSQHGHHTRDAASLQVGATAA